MPALRSVQSYWWEDIQTIVNQQFKTTYFKGQKALEGKKKKHLRVWEIIMSWCLENLMEKGWWTSMFRNKQDLAGRGRKGGELQEGTADWANTQRPGPLSHSQVSSQVSLKCILQNTGSTDTHRSQLKRELHGPITQKNEGFNKGFFISGLPRTFNVLVCTVLPTSSN